MKLLLDANISWRLTGPLKIYFSDCFHVDTIGFDIPATDITIWKYAQDNHLIIITNGDDFLNLVNIKGFPPKVVLLRTGNQSNSFIESVLIKHVRDIQELSDSNDYGLLELF